MELALNWSDSCQISGLGNPTNSQSTLNSLFQISQAPVSVTGKETSAKVKPGDQSTFMQVGEPE